jgi:hypothetical protein
VIDPGSRERYQLQLCGLLNRLRDLGIQLVSVNAVSEPRDAP